ncbi:MAG: diguanylate cyclase [Oscillospiraceae bacterium]|nr:diguanylate cyclase [Oscillospiraceae bacterium]
MRIRAKLIGFILIVLIIPVLAMLFAASYVINRSGLDYFYSGIENSVENQSDDINFICERIISQSKSFSISDSVKEYTAAAAGEDFSFDTESEIYQSVLKEMDAIDNYGESMIKSLIVSSDGIIIASSDSSDELGSSFEDHDDILASSLENNGFSCFFTSELNDYSTPIFEVSRIIYSQDNQKIGAFFVFYETSYIQKYLNDVKMDKYSIVCLMDGDGNILDYPFKALADFNESAKYASHKDDFSAIIGSSSDSENYIGKIVEASDGESCYFASPISNAGWYMVSLTDLKSMKGFIRQTYSGLIILAIVLLVVVIVAVMLFSGSFLKPVRNILEVFEEKKKGNANARFNIKTKDEFRDIGTAFNSMFDNVFESEQRYRTIVEMTNNITFEINYKKGTVFVSKNFNKKFSYRAKDDSLRESFIYNLRIHKDDKERYLSDIDRILGPANFLQGEYRVKSIYGDFIWIMIKATKFFDRNEAPTKIIGVIVDIDREKKSEMHLLQRASYDNLTQLYNREIFIKSLAARMEDTIYKRTLDAMMFIDLDDFKHFNDEYGHACGDEVLKFTADTLKEISFEKGFAGRFGGDEFVACITDLTLYGDSGKIAQEIIDVLGAGFTSESTGEHLSIKCSIGIAFLHESGKTTEEVIAAADEAMYNIKKHGKSAFAYAASKDGRSSQTVAMPKASSIDSDTSANASTSAEDDMNFFDPLI